MAFIDKIQNKEAFVGVYDLWARKNPSYEVHYEKEIIKPLTDFGKGTNETSEARAKILGAGYEILIMAFFIGLYSNKKRSISEDESTKDLGQSIQFWGNLDSKKNRKAYPHLREYIFISLVARTPEIDWYKLDKGEWTINEVVALLMNTMEEYINYGLFFISEKIQEDNNYFYNQEAFLKIFFELTRGKKEMNNSNFEVPESLD